MTSCRLGKQRMLRARRIAHGVERTDLGLHCCLGKHDCFYRGAVIGRHSVGKRSDGCDGAAYARPTRHKQAGKPVNPRKTGKEGFLKRFNRLRAALLAPFLGAHTANG